MCDLQRARNCKKTYSQGGLNLPELRNCCAEFGITTTGTREDMCNKILALIDAPVYEEIIPWNRKGQREKEREQREKEREQREKEREQREQREKREKEKEREQREKEREQREKEREQREREQREQREQREKEREQREREQREKEREQREQIQKEREQREQKTMEEQAQDLLKDLNKIEKKTKEVSAKIKYKTDIKIPENTDILEIINKKREEKKKTIDTLSLNVQSLILNSAKNNNLNFRLLSEEEVKGQKDSAKFVGKQEFYLKNKPHIFNLKRNITIKDISYINILKNKDQFILLLGEAHLKNEFKCKVNSDNCMDVIEFLHSLVDSNPKFFDLFLELAPLDKREILTQVENTNIGLIKASFVNCNMQKGCRYDNIRVHSTDIRSRKISEVIKEVIFDCTIIISKSDLGTPLNTKELKEIKKKYDDFFDRMGKVDVHLEYITKEINRIDEKFKTQCIQNKIADMYIELIRLIGNNISVIRQFELLLNDAIEFDNPEIYNWKQFDCLRNTISAEAALMPLHMDIYTISRMLHKFKNLKPNQPGHCKNVIFFGGLNHSKFYATFLEGCGYKSIYKFEISLSDLFFKKEEYINIDGNIILDNLIN